MSVSITTCLYRRVEFLPNLIAMVRAQDYPHALTEWLLLDDSPEPTALFKTLPLHSAQREGVHAFDLDGIAVYYYHQATKIPLGAKRNILNQKAQGDYIVIFDDDDYYPPTRISHGVARLREHPGLALAGANRMYMAFGPLIYEVGPYGPNHATGASLMYTRQYAQTHRFDGTNVAEESPFTNHWTEPLVPLDSRQSLLAMAHGRNTINKWDYLRPEKGYLNRVIHLTNLKLSDFIRPEGPIYAFFNGLV